MTDLTHRVEQAVLGALLSGADPEWASTLTAGDFTDPRHQTIFTAITSTGPQHDGLIGGLRRWLTRLRGGAAARELETYMSQLPGACPDQYHLATYLSMLTEAQHWRTVGAAARQDSGATARLISAINSLGQDTGAAPGPAGHVGAPARQDMDPLVQAVRPRARQMIQAATRPDRIPVVSAPAAVRGTAAAEPGRHPQPLGDELSREHLEELVLADLLNDHGDTRQVTEWLPADAFSAGPARDLYDLICGLLDENHAVDPLIVAWEADRVSRQSPAHDQPGHRATPDYALRIGALPAPSGSAETFGRALLAERICTTHFGPDWRNTPVLIPQPVPAEPGPAPKPQPAAEPAPTPPEKPAAAQAGTDAGEHVLTQDPVLDARAAGQSAPMILQPPRPAHEAPSPAPRR